jgi:uncharacterized protein
VTTYDTITMTCPNDSNKVEVTVMMSTNFLDQDTDFRRITGGISYREIAVSTCDRCGFTGGPEDFDGSLEPGLAQRIQEEIAPLARDERAAPERKWEYAAMIAEWRGMPPRHIAESYLNAAWCIRDQGSGRDEELEGYYRRRAAEWLEEAVAGEQGQAEPDRPALTYLIGELYRRIGEDSAAKEWFALAISEAEQRSEFAWVKKMAEEQRDHPRELT